MTLPHYGSRQFQAVVRSRITFGSQGFEQSHLDVDVAETPGVIERRLVDQVRTGRIQVDVDAGIDK